MSIRRRSSSTRSLSPLFEQYGASLIGESSTHACNWGACQGRLPLRAGLCSDGGFGAGPCLGRACACTCFKPCMAFASSSCTVLGLRPACCGAGKPLPASLASRRYCSTTFPPSEWPAADIARSEGEHLQMCSLNAAIGLPWICTGLPLGCAAITCCLLIACCLQSGPSELAVAAKPCAVGLSTPLQDMGDSQRHYSPHPQVLRASGRPGCAPARAPDCEHAGCQPSGPQPLPTTASGVWPPRLWTTRRARSQADAHRWCGGCRPGLAVDAPWQRWSTKITRHRLPTANGV